MPGFDRSGPNGTGPIGRGMGLCGNGQAGRGWGRGFRRGGRGWGFNQPILSPKEEKDVLENQKGWLEAQLAAVTNQLKGLDKNKGD